MVKVKKVFAIVFVLCSLFSSMRFATAVFEGEHSHPLLTEHAQLRQLLTAEQNSKAHLTESRERNRRPVHNKNNFLAANTFDFYDYQIQPFSHEHLNEQTVYLVPLPTSLRAPPTLR